MKVYLGVSALWVSIFHRAGTSVVAQTLNLLDAPFSVFVIHEAQINFLINEHSRRRTSRAAAAEARSLWNQRLAEEVFAMSSTPLLYWEEAYRLVVNWQAGKLELPPPQAMIHPALAALNGFDTFISVIPPARERAKEMGLTVLPKLLV